MKKYAFSILLAIGALNTTAWAANDPASDNKKLISEPVKKTESGHSKLSESKQSILEMAASSKANENKADAFSKAKPDVCVRPKSDIFSQSKADALSKPKPDTFNK